VSEKGLSVEKKGGGVRPQRLFGDTVASVAKRVSTGIVNKGK